MPWNPGWFDRFPSQCKKKQPRPTKANTLSAVPHKDAAKLERERFGLVGATTVRRAAHPAVGAEVVARDARNAAWQLISLQQSETEQGLQWSTAGNLWYWRRTIADLEAANVRAVQEGFMLERQAQRYTVPEEDWAELEPVLGWMFDFRDYE